MSLKYFVAQKDELDPCPWCHQTPAFIVDGFNNEVWCINSQCRACPKVSMNKNYTKDQVTRVWNSWRNQMIEKKNISNFLDHKFISKKQLNQILYECMPPEEIWKKYLPDVEYLTIQEEEQKK